jgi:hypothetical protein
MGHIAIKHIIGSLNIYKPKCKKLLIFRVHIFDSSSVASWLQLNTMFIMFLSSFRSATLSISTYVAANGGMIDE